MSLDICIRCNRCLLIIKLWDEDQLDLAKQEAKETRLTDPKYEHLCDQCSASLSDYLKKHQPVGTWHELRRQRFSEEEIKAIDQDVKNEIDN